MALSQRAIKTEKYVFDPPVLRFLVCVCMNLEKHERYAEFVKKVSKLFNFPENALGRRLCAEIANSMEFKEDAPLPGNLPAIYADIQHYTDEANAERDKLEILAELTHLDEEDLDDILNLMHEPIIRYCTYCKYAGYHKSNYFNHTFIGGHASEIICPAATRWED